MKLLKEFEARIAMLLGENLNEEEKKLLDKIYSPEESTEWQRGVRMGKQIILTELRLFIERKSRERITTHICNGCGRCKHLC